MTYDSFVNINPAIYALLFCVVVITILLCVYYNKKNHHHALNNLRRENIEETYDDIVSLIERYNFLITKMNGTKQELMQNIEAFDCPQDLYIKINNALSDSQKEVKNFIKYADNLEKMGEKISYDEIYSLKEKMQISYDEIDRCSEMFADYNQDLAIWQRKKKTEDVKEDNPKDQYLYFKGLSSKTDIEKRYKKLCAIYHPDNGGDNEIFIKINEEYNKILNK